MILSKSFGCPGGRINQGKQSVEENIMGFFLDGDVSLSGSITHIDRCMHESVYEVVFTAQKKV